MLTDEETASLTRTLYPTIATFRCLVATRVPHPMGCQCRLNLRGDLPKELHALANGGVFIFVAVGMEKIDFHRQKTFVTGFLH